MNDVSEQLVTQLVRERLQNCHPGGVTLDVVEEKVLKIDDWWRVPVLPNVQPPHTFEYYDALAGIEDDLQEERHLNILLVPTFPTEPTSVLESH